MSTIFFLIKVQGDKYNSLQGGKGDNISLNWDSVFHIIKLIAVFTCTNHS